jgi:hypothetical protein
MQFIEQWFGIYPDGGNGSLEMLYLLVLTGIVAAIGLRRRRRRATVSKR